MLFENRFCLQRNTLISSRYLDIKITANLHLSRKNTLCMVFSLGFSSIGSESRGRKEIYNPTFVLIVGTSLWQRSLSHKHIESLSSKLISIVFVGGWLASSHSCFLPKKILQSWLLLCLSHTYRQDEAHSFIPLTCGHAKSLKIPVLSA